MQVAVSFVVLYQMMNSAFDMNNNKMFPHTYIMFQVILVKIKIYLKTDMCCFNRNWLKLAAILQNIFDDGR